MILRDYRPTDAEKIVSWADNERDFYFWSADRYGHYPILSSEINDNYERCKEKTFFKPMIVEIDGKAVGHFILRTPCSDPRVIRIGFVIVDKDLRGRGLGKLLMQKAVDYAKTHLNAREINLGVFKQNESAIRCYTDVGFAVSNEADELSSFIYNGENWEYLKMVYTGN